MEDMSYEARELALYLENTKRAYTAYFLPMARAIAKKSKAGKFSRVLAEQGMLRVANEGAKSYRREHMSMVGPKWNQVFTIADRRKVAAYLVDVVMEEIGVAGRPSGPLG